MAFMTRILTPVSSRNDLQQQSILSETSIALPDGTSLDARVTSNNAIAAGKKGWYLDLYYSSLLGERTVSSPVTRGDKVIFTTLIPSSDLCAFGGTGWLMELNEQSGIRLTSSPFDLNQNNLYNASDKITYSSQQVAVSGIKSTVGIALPIKH